jgi:sugar fermentation stimulation protein A
LVDVGGVWVGVNPKIAKHSLLEAVTLDQVKQLSGYRLDDGTVAGAEGSGEILLHSMKDNCLLSYHPTVRAERGTAVLSLDESPSTRRQLTRLTEFASRGHRAIAFCHVLRSDCTTVRLSDARERTTKDLISAARAAGVEFLAFRAEVSLEGIGVGKQLGDWD